jgi:hypothetical protein
LTGAGNSFSSLSFRNENNAYPTSTAQETSTS